MGLSLTVSEINHNFSRTSEIYFLLFTSLPIAPLRGFPVEFYNGAGAKNYKDVPIPGCRSLNDIHSFTQYQRATDKQTDKQTELIKQYRALHALHADRR